MGDRNNMGVIFETKMFTRRAATHVHLVTPFPKLPVVNSNCRKYLSFHASNKHLSIIQGSNRGIGLAFVQQLLENDLACPRAAKGHVIAACRNPSQASELQALRNIYKDRLDIVEIDLADELSIQNASKAITDKFGRLDLLINCSAVLHLPEGEMVPETAIKRFDPEAAIKSFKTNALGAMLMMKHFQPLMTKTAQENNKHNVGPSSDGSTDGGATGTRLPTHSDSPIPVIANMSARVSSISDNKLGGWYSYRASKSALNQFTKTASIEFGRSKHPIVCVLLHPGTVETQLSEPFKKNVPKGKLFTPAYSAQQLLKVVDRCSIESNGRFFDYAGEEIAW